MKKNWLKIKQQPRNTSERYKAGWLTTVLSVLLLSSLSAQVAVQRFTESDSKHYYDLTVPAGFQYVYLLAKGADGGSLVNSEGITGVWGGEGVRASGWVAIGNKSGQIPVGSTLRLIPGQAGGSSQTCGGGGGGTAIAFKAPDANAHWVLLLVAGGGGGSGSAVDHKPGKAATTYNYGLSGENIDGDLIYNGGTKGGGGSRSGSNEGYPGGGAFTDGDDGCRGRAGTLNFEPVGGLGGSMNCHNVVAPGGFGFGSGGSGLTDYDFAAGGGGGGGYSGGGGGRAGQDHSDSEGGPGGGGGSYANADYLQYLSMQSFGMSPSNDGYVRYHYVNLPAIRVAGRQTKCLDPGGTSKGANILLNTCADSAPQTWFLTGSSFRLAAAPDKCLDLPNSNTASGTHIQLWDCNDSNAQNWIYDVANQAILSSIDADKCLNRAGGTIADRTGIQLYSCNGSDAQKWIVDSVQSALPGGKNLRIHLLIAPDKCLDIDQAYTGANGNNIRLYNCHTINHSQYFTFDGRRIKMQLYPNKCLDLDHSNTSNGSNIQLWDCNGTDAQNWIYDGFTRTFRSAIDPAKCLDLDHSMIANHTNIQIWDCNGSGAQEFEIY